MAELTREYIARKRQGYLQQIDLLNGALAALAEIEEDLFPKEAMTLDELKQATGASEIGEPVKIE